MSKTDTEVGVSEQQVKEIKVAAKNRIKAVKASAKEEVRRIRMECSRYMKKLLDLMRRMNPRKL